MKGKAEKFHVHKPLRSESDNYRTDIEDESTLFSEIFTLKPEHHENNVIILQLHIISIIMTFFLKY